MVTRRDRLRQACRAIAIVRDLLNNDEYVASVLEGYAQFDRGEYVTFDELKRQIGWEPKA